MGKYTNVSRLSKQEQNELFLDFVKSIGSLHNSLEAANYVKDLFSEAEVLILARRLQIARLLSEGNSYQQVNKITKASYTTIAKVQWWLKLYGEGYRMVIGRMEKKRDAESQEWKTLKRKYPLYFWPQILLGEIIKSANKKEKERLQKVITQLKEKSQLSKDLEQMLKKDLKLTRSKILQ